MSQGFLVCVFCVSLYKFQTVAVYHQLTVGQRFYSLLIDCMTVSRVVYAIHTVTFNSCNISKPALACIQDLFQPVETCTTTESRNFGLDSGGPSACMGAACWDWGGWDRPPTTGIRGYNPGKFLRNHNQYPAVLLALQDDETLLKMISSVKVSAVYTI